MTRLEQLVQNLYANIEEARGELTGELRSSAFQEALTRQELDFIKSWETRLFSLETAIEQSGLLPD